MMFINEYKLYDYWGEDRYLIIADLFTEVLTLLIKTVWSCIFLFRMAYIVSNSLLCFWVEGFELWLL